MWEIMIDLFFTCRGCETRFIHLIYIFAVRHSDILLGWIGWSQYGNSRWVIDLSKQKKYFQMGATPGKGSDYGDRLVVVSRFLVRSSCIVK